MLGIGIFAVLCPAPGGSKETVAGFMARVFADEHKTVIKKDPRTLQSKANTSLAASLAYSASIRSQRERNATSPGKLSSMLSSPSDDHAEAELGGEADENHDALDDGVGESSPSDEHVDSATTPIKINVLLVLTDQWRYSAMSSVPFRLRDFGIRTPSLDAFSAESVVFDRAFTPNPVCTPARASLLTGRYSHQHGLTTTNLALPRGEQTLAMALAANGYRTFYQGKWHLDGDPSPGFVPSGWRRFGFDHFEGFNRGHRYFDGTYYTNEGKEVKLPSNVFEPKFQVSRTIETLKTLAQEMNGAKPWFYMLSLGPPHDPFIPPARFMQHKRKLKWRPNVNTSTFPLPAGSAGGTERRQMTEGMRAEALRAAEADYRGYLGLCEAVDFEFGRLIEGLAKYGHADSTLVLFTSDHGDMM